MTAQNQAAAQHDSIVAMLAAVDVDFDRLEELQGLANTPRFVAGWNMPGYMPESDPASFGDVSDACEYIADEMESEADQIEPDAENPEGSDFEQIAQDRVTASALREAAETVRSIGAECGATVGQYHYWITQEGTMLDAEPGLREEFEELTAAANGCTSEDEAREALDSDPLSVEFRSGWSTDRTGLEAEEFCILLCTGGPAVRIVGELDQYGEPGRAWMEYQDWGTPWTQYHGADSAVLVQYASNFIA